MCIPPLFRRRVAACPTAPAADGGPGGDGEVAALGGRGLDECGGVLGAWVGNDGKLACADLWDACAGMREDGRRSRPERESTSQSVYV